MLLYKNTCGLIMHASGFLGVAGVEESEREPIREGNKIEVKAKIDAFECSQ